MSVRHITSKDNVGEDGYLRDPALVHHGSLEGGVIAALAGPVDPRTHLNLDFMEHQLEGVVVAEKLEVHSPVVRDEDGFFFWVTPNPTDMQHLGRIDLGARRIEWLNQFRNNR